MLKCWIKMQPFTTRTYASPHHKIADLFADQAPSLKWPKLRQVGCSTLLTHSLLTKLNVMQSKLWNLQRSEANAQTSATASRCKDLVKPLL